MKRDRFFPSLAGGLCGLLFLFYSASPSLAQPFLLEFVEFPKKYLLELSGTVMNEKFTGVQALMTLMAPTPENENPYQLIVEGFPKMNSRNSFFWNSNNSEMTAVANQITCRIVRALIRPVPMHFMFMSPELLRHTGALAALAGDEGIKFAEKTALPTLVYANSGELRLNVHANRVTGTIWMKGYDNVEKAFIHYSARFHGRRAYELEPRRELKK
jgi:hypothetical protein